MWEYEKPKQERILRSSPIVQRIRKRVKGAPGSFDESDIYYDKNNGKYYNRMQQEASAQDVTVEKIEWDKCKRLSERAGRAEKTTILAEAEQGEQTKFINFADSGAPILANEKYQFNTMPFNEGNELRVQPKVIRLYAEGYMAHALSLARSLTSSENYRKFYDLEDIAPADGVHLAADTGDILIKATEFDAKGNVAKRYETAPEFSIDNIPQISSEQTERFRNEPDYARQAMLAYQTGTENITKQFSDDLRVFYEAGLAVYPNLPTGKMYAAQTEERLEASFGTGRLGTTGDMSRSISARGIQRQYDIIQTTFFWMPWGSNLQNFCALKKFMINQRHKLKQGGKIRVTLINASRRNAEMDTKNGYLFVANSLIEDADIKRYYYIKKIELKNAAKCNEKYSDRLNALGLNPAGFTHTQTQKNQEVLSTGDLVIEATRKPAATASNVPLHKPSAAEPK